MWKLETGCTRHQTRPGTRRAHGKALRNAEAHSIATRPARIVQEKLRNRASSPALRSSATTNEQTAKQRSESLQGESRRQALLLRFHLTGEVTVIGSVRECDKRYFFIELCVRTSRRGLESPLMYLIFKPQNSISKYRLPHSRTESITVNSPLRWSRNKWSHRLFEQEHLTIYRTET
jgi:hypothetical protein